ncbi:MAG: hypothetical protein IJL00_04915 [Clostridia bacterium]|nr:hypothetical protein [Clostridia bacterium]
MVAKELTFEQVRDGIIMALHRAYPDAAVHSDRTLQNVVEGAFNVVFLPPRTPAHLGDVWLHSVTFDVVYYADSNSITDDMMSVATDLPLLLETITTPSGVKLHPAGSVEPTPMDDDTLHTIVRYDYHVIAKRVRVDDGIETPYKPNGDLDDTELMRRLQLHIPKEDDNGES